MGTSSEGKRMRGVFLTYYDKKKVESKEDIEYLDKLSMAAYIEYIYEGAELYAAATAIGKSMVPRL